MRTLSLRADGFSLIEVLIAVLVISSGILGFAAVQAVSVNNTAVARYQSLAAIEVSSMTTSLSVNRAYWANLAAPVVVCVALNHSASPPEALIEEISPPAQCPTTMSSGSGVLYTANADCTAIACSPVQMAAYGLKRWEIAMSQQGAFAEPAASISCKSMSPPPVSCLVTISWTEKNIGLTNPSGSGSGPLASGTTTRKSYSQLVQP